MKKKQRIITGVGLAAGLVAGGGAGLILESSGSAGASTPPTTTAPDPTTPGTTTPGAPVTPTPTPTAGKGKAADRNDRLKQVLQSLVDDGTLTQAQLDAVIAKLDTAGPVGGGGPGIGGRGGGRGIIGVGLDTVATTLGVTVDELRTALEGGTSIADYATSKGKTVQDVVDALVAKAKSELDARVAAGDMTQADADTKLAEATKTITDFVNNGFPAGFPGVGGRDDHPAGKGGQHKDFPGRGRQTGSTPDAPAATTPSTTTPSTTPATTGS